MHPDLLWCLVSLAVVRLLLLAATPVPAPHARERPGPEAGHHGYPAGDAQLPRHVAQTRPARLRPAAERTGRPVTSLAPARAAGQRAEDRGASGSARRGVRSRKRGSRGGQLWRTRPRSEQLYVAAINVQSLKPHLLELRCDIDQQGFDTISLSETWLKPATPNRLIPVPGYRILRNDRPDGRGYGGVAVLVRDALDVTVIDSPGCRTDGTKLETLWIQIRVGKRKAMLCSLYRPPIQTTARISADLDELERQLQHILTRHSGLILLTGDVNINMADNNNSTASSKFRELLSTYSMQQHIRGPTYEPSGSTIDVICSNSSVERSGSLQCDFSPHRWTRAIVTVPSFRPVHCSLSARCWRKLDVAEAGRLLDGADWTPVFESADPEAQWDYFVSVALPIIDRLAPAKRSRARNPTAPPVTDATKELMGRRRSALRNGDRSLYKDLNRRVKAAIRRDTTEELQRRIAAAGRSSMWRTIRPVISAKQPSRPMPTADADTMNNYFASVGMQIAHQVDSSGPELPVRLPRVTTGRFMVQPVTPESLATTVAQMSNSSASGADGLCVRFVKLCLPYYICHVLTHIVNSSLASHTVPPSWKLTHIHPIQKSPKSTKTSNYRPISILPTIAKIAERVVYEQLSEYFTSHHLFPSCQHGFRTSHSTDTALLTMTDRIFEAMDNRQVALLCLLDMSKCFDVIPHDRLITKLEQYNVDVRWFTSYLAQHYQQVVISSPERGRMLSQPLLNPIGTYQGSALAPLLYTIYAADMALYLDADVAHDRCLVQYADDVQIAVFGSPRDSSAMVHSLESNLAALSLWFRKNGIKVNASKTQLIVTGTGANMRTMPKIQLQFMGSTVTESSTVKNLGVVFDQTMTFSAHVSDVVRRCTGLLSGLSHSRHALPRGTLITIVQALVLSAIRYCISVYGVCGITQTARLQKLLNYGARVISGRRKHDHISDVLRDLKWLSAENMYRYHSMTLLKRMLSTGQPEHLHGSLVTRGDIHHRATRQAGQLDRPATHTDSGRRRFLFAAVTDYNALPQSLRDMGPHQFRVNLRKHLVASQNGPG